MTTSGQYTFNPGLGEIVTYAYNLIEVRPAALTQDHMVSARMAANMLLATFSNRGVNLWAVDLITTPLIAGQATYSVDPNTVMILDAYITISQGTTNTDRIILPVSRTEYASYPNKDQEGFPTTYWFDRLLSPTVSLWPVPQDSSNTLKYYRVRRLQDSNLAGGETVEIPYLWMEAFSYGLATRLALIWNPAKAQLLKPLEDEAYQIAAAQNTEYANVYIAPQLSGYFR